MAVEKGKELALRKAGGLGSKLLVGGGVLGGGLMLLDLLSMLQEGGEDSSFSAIQDSSLSDFERLLGAESSQGRLRRSQSLRDLVETDRSPSVSVSPELRQLLNAEQVSGLSKIRQNVKPSLRETYARYGLT